LVSLKKPLLQWRNRTTIRKQLSLILGLSVILAMVLIIMFNYISQTNTNIIQQTSMLHRVLEMELASLDKYVAELRSFSLQLRNQNAFMNLIITTSPFNYTKRDTIDTIFKSYFYSRNDLLQMDLYLIRQGQKLSLTQPERKITMAEMPDPENIPSFSAFTAKPDFCLVTATDGGFLEVTRTIIDSPYDTPLAIVRFVVNTSFAQALEQSHSIAEEQLCIFNADGEYLLPHNIANDDLVSLQSLLLSGTESAVMKIAGRDTLCVAASDSEYNFSLIAYKSMSIVNASLIATRNGSVLLGMLALIVAILMLISSIKFITTPLSQLAHRLRRVGTGNFTTKAALEGSYEIRGLSEDVNQMMDSIRELINTTYVAQLNERTAQLIALEAQTNPHFLFNTLQAISTQAIVNKQEAIYSMVTALAALLRYSVKGGNLATLETEFDYVEKYLSLQKARFNSRLIYECHYDEALKNYAIPKQGVLSLAENSINHGLKDAVTQIHIDIEAKIDGENMLLCVTDDGCGIQEDKLNALMDALASPSVSSTQRIGLMNLASRLKLLYDDRAHIDIQSVTAQPRKTTVCLLIPLEVLERV
jgi:two-component system, sensor histidine kinase YesM